LVKLLSALPLDFPLPIVVVQHMAEDFFESFVRFLKDACGHPVEQAHKATRLEVGRVYVAPARYELFVKENMTVKLLPAGAGAIISPSVDSLFFSMATSVKGRGIGVLLTGMGDDGAQGLLRMRRMGARTIVQDRATCAVYGMPKAAVELGAAEHSLALSEIAPFLSEKAMHGHLPAPQVRPTPLPAPQKRFVLVVDDDAQQLNDSREVLQRAGFNVMTLDNPLVLARTLRLNSVDALILEPELKTMKGSMVVQTLRSHGSTVPILLYSSASELTLNDRARECLAAASVSKGDHDGLIRALSRVTKRTES
jgi:chemotaxis response regulator CheB